MLVLESSVKLLLCLVHLVHSYPTSNVKPSLPVNEFIKYHEPAFYDVQELNNQHRRLKRSSSSSSSSSSSYQKGTHPFKFTISTSSRVFKLLLWPDESLFAHDAEFVGAKGRKINFDPGTVYVGTLEDDERTNVRGIITKDGLFDGTITTQFEEFYVEPVSRYKSSGKHGNGHSIVYKVTDVVQPQFTRCAISNSETNGKPTDPNTIARRSKRESENWQENHGANERASIYHKSHRPQSSYSKSAYRKAAEKETESTESSEWPKFKNLFPAHNQRSKLDSLPSSTASSSFTSFSSSSPSSYSFSSQSPLLALVHAQTTSSSIELSGGSDGGAYYDLDFTNFSPDLNVGGNKKNLDEDNNNTYRPTEDTNEKHWRPKSGIIDTVFKFINSTKGSKGYFPTSGIIHKSSPKILIGSGTEDSHANLIITSDDSLEQHARKRVLVDPKKTTCMMYLQADHLFFEKYGTEETCIEVMTRHVQKVNSIYRNTDFNQDGKPDNISFMIKRIKVHSAKDPSYRFPGNYGVEKFLEIFSEEDYDAFCLAYMFTYRDFEMGTLGLAWTGDLKNAGGVCEKNGHYRGSLKSLNTGIVTVLNYGKHVPSSVSHVTLAHEIGHNFGSPHDPEGCTPGGDDGNFIMFARATSGDKKNNNKFSPCSLHAINPVLNAKARSSKGCFTEPQTSICGNGVVEPGEECDCGWEEDCRDSCCYPQRRYPPLDEIPCRLTPNSVCSPSQGPCCTNNCQLKIGDMCRSDNGCRDSSYCNGSSPQCPPSVNKPNKTVCNEEFVCYMGECTGSICLAYGLESCQCIPRPSDPSTKACELCCKMPGENQPCLSSFEWNQAPYDVPNMHAKPGTPCNDYNGYCDVFRKCREVDPSGPIATLRKLLLSEENLASFKKWATDHWYYCALIFFFFVLLMIISTKFLGKKPKVKAVTVVHSSPTETVRLPDGGDGLAVVVHPIAVRSKLPFKKKVHEKKRRTKTCAGTGEECVPHNVNNNNSPVESKKKNKKRTDVKSCSKVAKNSKGVKKDTVVVATSGANAAAAVKSASAVSEDPLGKVRNWLMQSHNMDGFGSLKKSKSSPAGFDLSDPCATKKRNGRAAATATSPSAAKATTATAGANPSNSTTAVKADAKKAKKPKDSRVKLQVVYKPPFKFSVKLGRNKNEVSSHLIRDKRPEAVKQRTELFVRADRIRAKNANVNSANASPAKGNKSPVKTRDTDHKEEKIKEKDARTCKTEYKRSMSAPQPEPLYQNLQAETGVKDEKKSAAVAEEPQYANLAEAKISDKRVTGEKGVERGRSRESRNTRIRHSSSDGRDISANGRSSNRHWSSSKRRRNSYDMESTNNNKSLEMLVKRQHSDETDTKSAGARPSTDAGNVQQSRSNGHTTKPVRLKCSYDLESAMLMTPSVTSTKLPKRKSSHGHDESAAGKSSKDRRSNVRRSMSNSTSQKEGDKFKRFSLQNPDPKIARGSQEKLSHVPRTTSRDLVDAVFASAQQPEINSEIPSDLEVLLSEVENPN